MIDITVSDKFAKISISGSTFDLMAETLMCIRQIYKTINEQNHNAAETFRYAVTNNIDAAFLSTKELCEKAEKKGETIQKAFDKMFGGSSVQDLQNMCDSLERLSEKFSEGNDE